MLAIAALLLFAGPYHHPPALLLTVEPERPVRGSLVRLVATDTATTDRPWNWVVGSAGGEPLHFEAQGVGRFVALAGIPIEGPDSFPVILRISYGDGSQDTVAVSVFVRQPDYTMEKLRVAPGMAKPDSAAQVRIDKEIARAREIGVRSQSTPRLWHDPFLPPRDSRITSIFGTGREFNGKAVSRHLGTDYAGAVGDPVRATNRGVVAMVADFYLAGRVLYLDHGEGLVSAYFHLSSSAVAQGDTVERGQIIGAVGKSGRVTGPHLHWVVRYGTVPVNPTSMLELLGK